MLDQKLCTTAFKAEFATLIHCVILSAIENAFQYLVTTIGSTEVQGFLRQRTLLLSLKNISRQYNRSSFSGLTIIFPLLSGWISGPNFFFPVASWK